MLIANIYNNYIGEVFKNLLAVEAHIFSLIGPKATPRIKYPATRWVCGGVSDHRPGPGEPSYWRDLLRRVH